MSSDTPPSNSLGGLLQDLRDETSTLLRQEVALAKTELNEKASRLTSNAVRLATGGFVVYAGVLVLLFGLADLVGVVLAQTVLAPTTALWVSRGLVGIVVALIGWAMLAKAKKAISAENLVPEQTVRSLQENKRWAQTKITLP